MCPSRGGRIPNARNSCALAALLLAAGCASVGEQLEEAKSSWQGATYDEVVTRWGPPARSTTLADGRQTHTWTSQEAPVRPYGPSVGVGVFGGSGGYGGVGVGVGVPIGSGAASRSAFCERTLTFEQGRLSEQSWTGDPGYCRYFKRG